MKNFFLFTFLIILSVVVKGQDVESDIIAYYPFDGNANNTVGSAADGVVHGALLTTDRLGNEDQAYYFRGNSYIEIADGDTDFNLKSTGFTVSLWVYPEADQFNSTNVILSLGLDAYNGWGLNYLSVPRFEVQLYKGDVYDKTRSYVYIDSDQWYHYVLVYEDGYVQMYANGKQFLKEYCPNYNPVTGSNFLIGANTNYGSGFTGKIDELKIYDRALSFLEVGVLSDNESTVDAAVKGTVFHADFENNTLESEQLGYNLDTENGGSVTVVENPEKDDVNSSDYVIMAKTPKSSSDSHTRAEYTSLWSNQFETKEKLHIFQWMVYFPEDHLIDIDVIRGHWHAITQFVTHPCAKYEEGFGDAICESGGIFNDVIINSGDHNKFDFLYRAEPDCNTISYTYPRGEWIKFTYQIFWTTEFDGFYRVWANEKLLGEAYDVRTLPEGWREGECDIRWKVGLYDSWYDEEIDSVYYYIDNLETYIDQDIRDICPQCVAETSTGDYNLTFNNDLDIKLFPNPSTSQISISGLDQPANIVVYNMNGSVVKELFATSNFTINDLTAGVYMIEIHTDCEVLVRRIVKM